MKGFLEINRSSIHYCDLDGWGKKSVENWEQHIGKPSHHEWLSLKRPSSNQVSPRASCDLCVENNFWLPSPAVKMVACEQKQFLAEDLSSSSRKAWITSKHLAYQSEAEVKGHPSRILHPKSFLQLLKQSALSKKLWWFLYSIILVTIPDIMSPSPITVLFLPSYRKWSLAPHGCRYNLCGVPMRNAKPSWGILPRKIQQVYCNELWVQTKVTYLCSLFVLGQCHLRTM